MEQEKEGTFPICAKSIDCSSACFPLLWPCCFFHVLAIAMVNANAWPIQTAAFTAHNIQKSAITKGNYIDYLKRVKPIVFFWKCFQVEKLLMSLSLLAWWGKKSNATVKPQNCLFCTIYTFLVNCVVAVSLRLSTPRFTIAAKRSAKWKQASDVTSNSSYT